MVAREPRVDNAVLNSSTLITTLAQNRQPVNVLRFDLCEMLGSNLDFGQWASRPTLNVICSSGIAPGMPYHTAASPERAARRRVVRVTSISMTYARIISSPQPSPQRGEGERISLPTPGPSSERRGRESAHLSSLGLRFQLNPGLLEEREVEVQEEVDDSLGLYLHLCPISS